MRLAAAGTRTLAAPEDPMPDAARLTRRVLPTRYDLVVETDADATRFNGEVTIDLDVVEPTTTIVLHAKELDVELVGLTVEGRAGRRRARGRRGPRAHHRWSRAQSSRAGPAALRLRFARAGQPRAARLLPQHVHRHRRRAGACSRRRSSRRRTRAARSRASTSRSSRRSSTVTLVVADGLLAISNGPEVARESLGDGRVRVSFAPTIPMSTYLVAWVVGPLELTAPVDAGGVQLRVAHVPGKEHLTAFALDIGSVRDPLLRRLLRHPVPG